MALSGNVVDNSDNPIEGAVVVLVDADTREVVGRQTTDASGNYEFPNASSDTVYHAAVRYEDADGRYQTTSRPYVNSEIAGSGSVIEDWERNTPIQDYNGSTGSMRLVETKGVTSGDRAMRMDPGANFAYSLPGDGLPNYPSSGESFKVDIKPGEGSIATFAFGVQSLSDYYAVKLSQENSRVIFDLVENGAADNSFRKTKSMSIVADTFYEIGVNWEKQTDGEIFIQVKGIDGPVKIVASTSRYSDGGIGWGEASV